MPKIEIANGLYFVECSITLIGGVLIGLVLYNVVPQVKKAINELKRIFRK